MNDGVTSLISSEVLKSYSNITLIDINIDKVTYFTCQDTLKETGSNTYEEYYEKLKKVLHPDYINKYFEAISLNNLTDTKVVYCKKLSDNLSYDDFNDYIKLVKDNTILILSTKIEKEENIESINSDSSLVLDITEMIVSLENVLSSVKSSDDTLINLVSYTNELLDGIKKKSKSVLNKYKEKVTVEASKKYQSLLIIDDDSLTRNIFKKIFEDTYHIIEAKNGSEAVEIIEKNVLSINTSEPENIVGMFLDLKMPVMDGFGVLDYLNNKNLISRMPVIIISADDEKETKEKVYKYEIADMIEKPFNYDLIKKRVNNLTTLYAKSNYLNEIIRHQDIDLKKVIKSLKNKYLLVYKNVNEQKNRILSILLNNYAEVSSSTLDIDCIVKASDYYDVGIDSVPKNYFEKISLLTKEEKELIYNYPKIGDKMIRYVIDNESDLFIKYATDICKLHNERYDGYGFPYGLKENNIPIYVYLTNIALECCNSKIDKNTIINQIRSKENKKYSPEAIKIFNAVIDKIFL